MGETIVGDMLYGTGCYRAEAGVKVYVITHIASGAYTADKFEREMQRNVDTMVRALVTEP